MATPVEVPKLGNTVEECIVAKWHKRKGEKVAAGELVAEIETDKATFEVAAPVEGTLLETFFEEGALVPVFTVLFVIGTPGETVDAPQPGAAVVSRNPDPRDSAPAPVAEAPQQVYQATASSVAMSPRARRFAEDHNFHPPAMAGSGPGGRILEEDLRQRFYSQPRTPPPPRKAEVPKPAKSAAPARPSGIRDRIARRMRESLASTAQYTLNASANAGGLLALRARIKASRGLPDINIPDININDLLTFCAIKALLDAPDLNAEYIDGKIVPHASIQMGFACDTPRGLMVPVVRESQGLSVAELAVAMKELARRTVDGTILPDDLSGATFTVSNLGGLGIESFTPLLNPPQVAILGIGAIQVKPLRREGERDGKLEFIDAIGLSLTCDHQVIDGAPGARFLQILRHKIENVESLCTI
jgi:pyruvate dehydrogenase E2 component (dihydrolipoamide acetyltransferase)